MLVEIDMAVKALDAIPDRKSLDLKRIAHDGVKVHVGTGVVA